MKREDKISLVENLSKKFDENNIFYIMDASGLTVSQVNQFREKCFKKDVEYKVVKNSFIKKALENNENDYSPLINKDVLSGFSGILFSKLSPSEPAKILKDFREITGEDYLKLKAASIDLEFYIGDENLNSLSKLKSKNELIGGIITLLKSPIKNVLNSLKGAESKLSGVIKQLENNSK